MVTVNHIASRRANNPPVNQAFICNYVFQKERKGASDSLVFTAPPALCHQDD